MSAACERCGLSWEGAGARNGAWGAGATCPDCGQAAAGRAWHIAVGDSAQGPYTLEQLRDRYARGAIAFDQYVFCDGWADWKLASEVDELRSRPATASVRPPIPRPAQTDDIVSGAYVRGSVLEDDATSGRFSVRAALASAREMGDDPFETDDADARASHRRQRSEDVPADSWGDGPEEAWDLDNMPALEGLLSRGRTSAPEAPTVASASAAVESVAPRPASSVTQPSQPLRATRGFSAPGQERGRELRELGTRWLVAAASSVARPAYSRSVEAAGSFLRQQSRRPGLLLAVALTGFCTGVTGLVAWAVGGRADSSATVKTSASPMSVVVIPPPATNAAPAVNAVPAPVPVPVAAPVPAAAPMPSAASTVALSGPPSEPTTGEANSDTEAPAARLANARSLDDTPSAGSDTQSDDGDGRYASGETLFRERERVRAERAERAERAAAAKEARERRLKLRFAKHGHTQRLSAKIAGISRSSHKTADIPFADSAAEEEASAAPRVKKPLATKGGSNLDDLVEGAIGAGRRHSAEPAHASASFGDEAGLPATPSREQMLSALTKAKAVVAQCEGSGTVTASIHIKGPVGRAVKVDVDGASGSSRACVESAIRRTPFPKFQQDNFEVRVGLKLQDS